MNGVQTRFKCKLDVKRCKRFVFPPSSLLPRSNALKTKAIRYFQTDRTLTRIVSPPLHSALYGKELDAVFEQSDMGIGSLARHRSGIDKIKTLKNREYAARGIPFVYSETDDDFEHQPYILKAAPDDSPLDIEKVIRFYQSLKTTPLQIRMSIEQSLSWKAQMQIVINETFE